MNLYSSLETTNESDLGYGQLLAKLWRRRFWFAGVFTGVMAVTIPLAILKKPIYQSNVQILVEPNYQKSADSNANNEHLEREFADRTIDIDYATQLRVFKSAKILDSVARELIELNLDKEILDEAILNELANSSSNDELIEARIGLITEFLRESLYVDRIVEEDETQTKIIQASYVGSNPVATQKIIETIQQVYLQYNLEQQEKRLRDGLNFINKQIPDARLELQQAQAAVTKLSKKHNLISPEEDAKALKENIRQITDRRNELKAQQSQIKGSNSSMQKQLGFSTENSLSLSRLSQSTRYQNLLNKLQETEILLAAERQKFTDENPIIQSLIERRDSERSLLIDEAIKILGELPAGFASDLESMTKQGNLVDSDTSFIDRIAESQSNLIGIRDRDLSMAQTQAQIQQQLDKFPEIISQYKNLTQQVEVKRQVLQRLLEAKQELEIELNRGGFNWQIIEPASLGEQIAPNLQKDLMLGVVVASFLGLIAAFIRETIDKRIIDIQEIEPQLSVPILGMTPKLSLSSSKNFFNQLPFLATPSATIKDVIEWPPFRESLDLIHEKLKLASVNSSLKSLAITSSIAGEGKSTFTLGLALSVARHQQRVLVIDADLRCPSLHKPFNLNNDFGLSDYLTGNAARPTIKQISYSGESIDLITSGAKPIDPVKVLHSGKLQYLIEQQKLHYDLILIDTPSVVGTVDAIKVASVCDNSIIIMRLDKVKVSQLLETTNLFSTLKVLGIVANNSHQATRQYNARSQYLLSPQI